MNAIRYKEAIDQSLLLPSAKRARRFTTTTRTMFCSLCKRIFLMKQHVWYTLFGFLFLAAAVFADEVKITGLSREAVVKNEPSRAVMGYLNTSYPDIFRTPEPSVFHAASAFEPGRASPFRSTGVRHLSHRPQTGEAGSTRMDSHPHQNLLGESRHHHQ